MGKMHFTLSDTLEDRIRDHNKRKGDMSNLVEKALSKYLDELEE